ncbi:MAG: hypothetical protein ACYC09_12990 [Bacteroidota bacterium]
MEKKKKYTEEEIVAMNGGNPVRTHSTYRNPDTGELIKTGTPPKAKTEEVPPGQKDGKGN